MTALRKKIEGSKKRELYCHTAFGLEIATPTLPWVSSLPACPADFRLSPHNCVNQFLKPGTQLSLSLSLFMCIYTHILFILFLWRTLTNTVYVLLLSSASRLPSDLIKNYFSNYLSYIYRNIYNTETYIYVCIYMS